MKYQSTILLLLLGSTATAQSDDQLGISQSQRDLVSQINSEIDDLTSEDIHAFFADDLLEGFLAGPSGQQALLEETGPTFASRSSEFKYVSLEQLELADKISKDISLLQKDFLDKGVATMVSQDGPAVKKEAVKNDQKSLGEQIHDFQDEMDALAKDKELHDNLKDDSEKLKKALKEAKSRSKEVKAKADKVKEKIDAELDEFRDIFGIEDEPKKEESEPTHSRLPPQGPGPAGGAKPHTLVLRAGDSFEANTDNLSPNSLKLALQVVLTVSFLAAVLVVAGQKIKNALVNHKKDTFDSDKDLEFDMEGVDGARRSGPKKSSQKLKNTLKNIMAKNNVRDSLIQH